MLYLFLFYTNPWVSGLSGLQLPTARAWRKPLGAAAQLRLPITLLAPTLELGVECEVLIGQNSPHCLLKQLEHRNQEGLQVAAQRVAKVYRKVSFASGTNTVTSPSELNFLVPGGGVERGWPALVGSLEGGKDAVGHVQVEEKEGEVVRAECAWRLEARVLPAIRVTGCKSLWQGLIH